MTDKEQIIIDGIDVSNCNHIIAYDPPEWQGTWGGAIHKGACKIYSKDCKYNSNCYFKQLARKTQECEELQKELMRKDEVNTFFNTPTEGWSNNPCDICESKNNYDHYRKALEEIVGLVKNFCKDCDDYEDCNWDKEGCYYSLIPNLKDIINKAKGE